MRTVRLSDRLQSEMPSAHENRNPPTDASRVDASWTDPAPIDRQYDDARFAPLSENSLAARIARTQPIVRARDETSDAAQLPRPRGARRPHSEPIPFQEAEPPLRAPLIEIDRNLQAALEAFEQVATRSQHLAFPPFVDPVDAINAPKTEVLRLPATWYADAKVEEHTSWGAAAKSGVVGLGIGLCVMVSTAVYLSGVMRHRSDVVSSDVVIGPPQITALASAKKPAAAPEVSFASSFTDTSTPSPGLATLNESLGQTLGQRSRIVAEPNVLMTEARRAVTSGDIETARLLLAHPAATGQGEAMLLLGETFDPNVLASLGTRGVIADANRARTLYEAAATRGISAATDRLRGLN
jgi:hypothetical protein